MSTVRAVRWQAASFAGAPSPGLISPDPDAEPAPQRAVPAPANEAALQLICFKYVAGAHDVRKLLSELHDVESGGGDRNPLEVLHQTLSAKVQPNPLRSPSIQSRLTPPVLSFCCTAPDIIIVADDLSSLLGGGNGVVGTSVASAGRWGAGLGSASPESELALTLAQLIEALSFCDRAGSARGGQICRSELLIAEDLSREAPAPKMFFVYEKFIPSFFSVHPAEASDGCSTTGVGGGRNVEREGFELSQLNHRACASCSERWMARFSAGEGSVDTVRFCC